MLPFRIALRFLKTSPVQSALIMTGIAVGIATQVFVGSLITSLQADLIDTTVGSSSHITLVPLDGDESVDEQVATTIVKTEPLITTAVALRTLPGLYSDGFDSVPLTLKGADFAGLDTIYKLSDRLTEGTPGLDADEIIVGAGFAEDYGVGAGDTLELLLPDGSPGVLTVRGVFDLGAAAANDRIAFVDPAFAGDALGLATSEYTSIETQLSDVFASTEVAARLANEVDATVLDWQVENESLLSGLQAQSSSSYMIQVFILIAVALGIASTLAISAVQKTRQIGILKAMGLNDRQAGGIFLWQAALLGAGGVIGGLALGFLLLWGFSFAPVTFSIAPEPTFIAISAGIGLAVALASSIIPARRTSRVDPIEVIQSA
jgi:lipoprotein-releasing system permease protein